MEGWHRQVFRLAGTGMILSLVTACGGNPPAGQLSERDPCLGGWVQLFEDANFSGDQLTIEYPMEVSGIGSAAIAAGAGNLNDAVSSARWFLPVGCRLVLHADEGYRGGTFPLLGTGRQEENSNLGSFNDVASSANWQRS